MSKPTKRTRGLIVHSATNHSAQTLTLRTILSFTLGKRRTSAHSATAQPIGLVRWDNTFYNTQERNPITANNVNSKHLDPVIWRFIYGSILGKSVTRAQRANILFPYLVIWKDTWRGSIQEKSPTSVTSATTPALKLETYKGTWWFTLERNNSSATGAKKPSNGECSWQDIPKCIRPEYDPNL